MGGQEMTPGVPWSKGTAGSTRLGIARPLESTVHAQPSSALPPFGELVVWVGGRAESNKWSKMLLDLPHWPLYLQWGGGDRGG